MPVAPDPGYVKVDPRNLPQVTAEMLFKFFNSVPSLNDPAIQNKKTLRSTKSSYGDNAVGFVQTKREGKKCFVKGVITPEHSVHKKAYNVVCIVDEDGEEPKIAVSQCEDCAASAGCCKHAICLVSWLHRRTEEPSVTSGDCLWKRPTLSLVGSSLKFKLIEEKAPPPLVNVCQDKMSEFFNACAPSLSKGNSLISSMLEAQSSLSMHVLMIDYKKTPTILT